MFDVIEQVVVKNETIAEDWQNFLTADRNEGWKLHFDFTGELRWSNPAFVGEDLACYRTAANDANCVSVRMLESIHGRRIRDYFVNLKGDAEALSEHCIVAEPEGLSENIDAARITLVMHDPKDLACTLPYGYVTLALRFVDQNEIMEDCGEEQDAKPGQASLFIRVDGVYLRPEYRGKKLSLRFVEAIEMALFSGFEGLEQQAKKAGVTPDVECYVSADILSDCGEVFAQYVAMAAECVQEELTATAKASGRPSPFSKKPYLTLTW